MLNMLNSANLATMWRSFLVSNHISPLWWILQLLIMSPKSLWGQLNPLCSLWKNYRQVYTWEKFLFAVLTSLEFNIHSAHLESTMNFIPYRAVLWVAVSLLYGKRFLFWNIFNIFRRKVQNLTQNLNLYIFTWCNINVCKH